MTWCSTGEKSLRTNEAELTDLPMLIITRSDIQFE